jgi:hypothetical protein
MSVVDLDDKREEEEAVCILQLIIFFCPTDDEAEIRENLFSLLSASFSFKK